MPKTTNLGQASFSWLGGLDVPHVGSKPDAGIRGFGNLREEPFSINYGFRLGKAFATTGVGQITK